MSAAFLRAERVRRQKHTRPTTARQRRYLDFLARKAGVEAPTVAWFDQADDAIKRLKHHIRQPALELGV